VKGRTPVSVLIAMLVTAALAAPAAAAQGTEGLPTDLWDPAPAEPSAPGGSSGDVRLVLVLGLLAGASVAGFAVAELAPGRGHAGRARGPLPARPRGPRSEACAIVIARAGARAQLQVVAGRGPGRAVIGRSPPFEVPRSGPVPDDGPARAAYDVLIARLQARGWRLFGPEPSVWYHAQLVRARRHEAPTAPRR